MIRPAVFPKSESPPFAFYEFFAGGGMARAGLGDGWRCLFANDFDPAKAKAYRENWGDEALVVEDIARLSARDLPGRANLAWASFPCQDLSLAGLGAGLQGPRSGTFWAFVRLMSELRNEGRAPEVIALENVVGALHSNGGDDFSAIIGALAGLGYAAGALVIDAAHFVPQSRPRLFVVAFSGKVPGSLARADPSALWHPRALVNAFHKLPAAVARSWVWWDMSAPPRRQTVFADLIVDEPEDVSWHDAAETEQLLFMMSPANRAKVKAAIAVSRASGKRIVGAVYKRTRKNELGEKVQRAEIRFDDVAGCLRTPAGGSSRQMILVVEGTRLRSRLLSSREAARLMGLPDSYKLPPRYNEAYHLAGDGVVAPAVRHLAGCLLEPLCRSAEAKGAIAA